MTRRGADQEAQSIREGKELDDHATKYAPDGFQIRSPFSPCLWRQALGMAQIRQ